MCIRAGTIVAMLVALLVALLAGLVGTARAAEPDPVLLVGVAGLRWTDVSAERTPTLYALADRATLGTVSVRAVDEPTCPLDGWLTLSAGVRATAPHPCRPIPDVTGDRVPDWDALTALQHDTGYAARPGRLGGTLAAGDRCATAIGPGAAVALADRRGRVPRYADRFDADVLAGCPLAVVDGGVLPSGSDAQRTKALRDLDQLLERVVEAAGRDGTVLVAGLADEPDADRTALRLGLVAGPDFGARWLGSASTRQDGLGQLTDLTPTLAGGEPAWHATGERPSNLAEAIRQLRGFDTAERVIRQQSAWLYAGLVAVQLVGYGLALGLRRRRVAVVVAAVAGSVPAATFLTELLPWATSTRPTLWLWTGLLGFAVLLGGLATRAPSRLAWAAPTVLAAATALVLALDVTTGSRLQGGTLLTPGDLPVVGGRFFGLGNVGFGIFAVGALVLAGGVAEIAAGGGSRRGRERGCRGSSPADNTATWARARGHTRAAWLAALGIGGAAVLIDGWPGWGADFGGVLALVPGVLLLVCGVAGIRLRVRHVVLAGLAAVGAVGAVAVADWLRPADRRSHLGGFVQQVLDGEALPVVVRKAEASLGTVTAGGGLGLLVIAAYVAAALLVLRPTRFGAAGLDRAYQSWPTLSPTLRALLVVGVVGFAVNDSGLVVPAVVLLTGVPLVVLAIARQPEAAQP